MRKHYNIPIFVPHAGCPHDCVFCNQKKITGYDHAQDIKEAESIIEDHLKSISRIVDETTIEIAFFGGSFTGIPETVQKEYLELANRYIISGLIDGIRLSTRPDYIDVRIVENLKSYGVTTIELGVQSLVSDVLELSNRGHSLQSVEMACRLIRNHGIKLGLQMMIGLPGDTYEKTLETTHKIIELKPDMVRIYPTIVIEGTELEVMYRSGNYVPLDLMTAVKWTSQLYKLYIQTNIPVIRMGLQATEALESYIAGPYHPSFRQYVESYLYLESLHHFLKNHKIEMFEIYVHPKEISYLVGQKRMNLNELEQQYNLGKVKVYPKELDRDYFEIKMNDKVFKVPKISII
ncbi:MAG: radical SAM protein [Clostridiales bacterium]|nr:radical SAM protein [Clostridiales bacterium]